LLDEGRYWRVPRSKNYAVAFYREVYIESILGAPPISPRVFDKIVRDIAFQPELQQSTENGLGPGVNVVRLERSELALPLSARFVI
jgi:hypothetical protein